MSLIYSSLKPDTMDGYVSIYEDGEHLDVIISGLRKYSRSISLKYAIADIKRVSNDVINHEEKYINFAESIKGVKIKKQYPLFEIKYSGIIPPLAIKKEQSYSQLFATYFCVLGLLIAAVELFFHFGFDGQLPWIFQDIFDFLFKDVLGFIICIICIPFMFVQVSKNIP